MKRKLTNKKREALAGYTFIMVWIIGFLLLNLFPLFASFYYSFNDIIIDGEKGLIATFSGFKNYIDAFTSDPIFLTALGNYLLDVAIYLPLIIIISMIIAMLLNQKIKGRGFFRAVFFLPVIISSGPVIDKLISQSGDNTSSLTSSAMVENIKNILPAFLSGPIELILEKMIIILWFSGVQIVLFLAGLQKIDREVYEAAEIDGASPWESFWKITLPALRPIILVSSIYTIVMLSTFANNEALKIIRGNMFTTGYGYSSALAWIYFILVALVLGLIALLIAQPWKNRFEKEDKRYVKH
jgi:ABC-type sugar transport system permease subunit